MRECSGRKILGNSNLFPLYAGLGENTQKPECLWHLGVHEPGLPLSLFWLQTICFTGSSVRYPVVQPGGFQAPHLWGTWPSRGFLVVFGGDTKYFLYWQSFELCWRQNCFKRLLKSSAQRSLISQDVSDCFEIKMIFWLKVHRKAGSKSAGDWDIEVVPVQNRQFYLADTVL